MSPAPLLFDASHTSHTAAQTGIQRVVRTFFSELSGRQATLPICYDPHLIGWRALRPDEIAVLCVQTGGAGRSRGARWTLAQKLSGAGRRWLGRRPILPAAAGLICPELFSAKVGSRLPELLARVPGPRVAIFYDAIPLKFPELTPAGTVARFPAYLRELLVFDGVAAISEDSAGSASRSDGKVEVKIAKPKSEQFTIAPNFQFPNQHLAAIIQAAQQGRHFVQVDLFDGSESGAKSYATSAVIGAENTGGDELGDEATAKGAGLTGIRYWPVTVSYFSGEPEGGEQKPSYELSFIMYENGITRRMRLDYGDFALRGKLVKLELTPAKMPAKGCR